mmetsp:Transcript_9328/g.23989  ORF Transcript_9328/g.23989 Transcript_9328/m.23989 type:complete len:93 (+) Transcript_9328:1209-1487(+)
MGHPLDPTPHDGVLDQHDGADGRQRRRLRSDADYDALAKTHGTAVRAAAKKFGVRLVEIDIESPTAGATMSRAFGIRSACWRRANWNRKLAS